MTFDGKAFGAEIVGVVKGYLEKEMAPLLLRIDAIEKRIDAIPAPVDLSADLAALKSAVEAIEIPELPHAPDLPDIGTMVDDAVKTAVASIPVPQDGRSLSADDVAPLIAAEVERRVSEVPKAKDGESGIDGKDGVSIAGAFIDREGSLTITLSNGEVKSLGPVVGKDGDPGKPGRDGFSLDDFDASLMDDGRTILLSFVGKEMDYKVELAFPAMVYRGVFNDGKTYVRGDTVTWGGSLWHCESETADKPGEGAKAWTLCAKKGRDGKDGVVKETRQPQPVRVGAPVRGS